jgi:hypothetical protein
MAAFYLRVIDDGQVREFNADSATGREYEALATLLSAPGYAPSAPAHSPAPAPSDAPATAPASNG